MTTGFTDIHCHGGGGYSFSDPNPENIQKVIDTHRSHGTTTQVASLVTEPIEKLKIQIKNLMPFVDSGALAGIHLEGPYLSPAKCGAHDPRLLRQPKIDEIASLIDVAQGRISMVTIAPELPGAIEAIRFLTDQRVTVAIGHSDATFDQARAAIDAGATVVTHMFNALPPLDHRNANISNAVLSDPNIFFELILDGIHVNHSTVQILLQVAPGRIILITDAMSAAGGTDGDYRIGELDVQVKAGVATLRSNGSLAGSTLTMDNAYNRLLIEHSVGEVIAIGAAKDLGRKVLGI
jgi:N-acetylglucosamine-6-phosphate deacetylase